MKVVSDFCVFLDLWWGTPESFDLFTSCFSQRASSWIFETNPNNRALSEAVEMIRKSQQNFASHHKCVLLCSCPHCLEIQSQTGRLPSRPRACAPSIAQVLLRLSVLRSAFGDAELREPGSLGRRGVGGVGVEKAKGLG